MLNIFSKFGFQILAVVEQKPQRNFLELKVHALKRAATITMRESYFPHLAKEGCTCC